MTGATTVAPQRIGIVGGGITGISTAIFLRRDGHRQGHGHSQRQADKHSCRYWRSEPHSILPVTATRHGWHFLPCRTAPVRFFAGSNDLPFYPRA